jgi:sialic acid synthase SpsE
MGVFVIAEVGSTHDCDISKAYRLISYAKTCGADAVKFQWTSSGKKMAARRGLGADAAKMYQKYLEWTPLELLKAYCDKVGIEFMCTVYLIEDIATIAPLVKRFKISAFESGWQEFVEHHAPYHRETIISGHNGRFLGCFRECQYLHCVSKYPTPIEELGLAQIKRHGLNGLSDHTGHPLVGALAVAAGATIIESHIRAEDTDPNNPDFLHSLSASPKALFAYAEYVENLRLAEKAL